MRMNIKINDNEKSQQCTTMYYNSYNENFVAIHAIPWLTMCIITTIL